MPDKVSPPLFTLRGHNAGVTSLDHCMISGIPYLASGDEEGTVIIWNLITFRILIKYTKVVSSRVQSLKVISLKIDNEKSDVLVVQSRDNGILLLHLNRSIQQTESSPVILESFSSAESLFSRGDALNIDDSRAILAYPSSLENYLVTIRILIEDAKTQLSGTAQRSMNRMGKHCNVFDIKIEKDKKSGGHFLFIAYEDGCLGIFSFELTITTTVPVLNSEGLKVTPIKNIDLKIADFISAFGIIQNKYGDISAICGSALNKLVVVSHLLDSNVAATTQEIALKRPGTSAIAVRPDFKLFAVANWDTKVRLYSTKSLMHLANINHHAKQVQSLLYIQRPNADLCSKDDSSVSYKNTDGKYLLCCASLEGTISISAIY